MEANLGQSGAPPTPASGAEKATGPVVAALYALGVGTLALGIFTTLAEASTGFKDFLAFSDKVGPLSGKAIFAVIVFVVTWIVGHLGLRDKNPSLDKAVKVVAVLFVLGLIGTFPPFFEAFAPEE